GRHPRSLWRLVHDRPLGDFFPFSAARHRYLHWQRSRVGGRRLSFRWPVHTLSLVLVDARAIPRDRPAWKDCRADGLRSRHRLLDLQRSHVEVTAGQNRWKRSRNDCYVLSAVVLALISRCHAVTQPAGTMIAPARDVGASATSM